jgi:hypothetical protein
MQEIVNDNKIYKQGVICSNEKERRERYLASHHRYNTKKYDCTECGKTLSIRYRAAHQKTKTHIYNKNNYIS